MDFLYHFWRTSQRNWAHQSTEFDMVELVRASKHSHPNPTYEAKRYDAAIIGLKDFYLRNVWWTACENSPLGSKKCLGATTISSSTNKFYSLLELPWPCVLPHMSVCYWWRRKSAQVERVTGSLDLYPSTRRTPSSNILRTCGVRAEVDNFMFTLERSIYSVMICNGRSTRQLWNRVGAC
jgi:hypothetical protein